MPKKRMRQPTQINTILGEESTSGPEVDTTSNDVGAAESWSVRLARCCLAEAETVITVICPRVRLPTGEPIESYFRARESYADQTVSWSVLSTLFKLVAYHSLPFPKTVTSK